MNTEEQARELLAQDRQQTERLNDNLLERSTETITEHSHSEIEERSRELLASERQHQQHLQENLLTRATEEIR